MTPKKVPDPQRRFNKIRKIARIGNITRTAARHLIDEDIDYTTHRKDCPEQRDRWLYRRGVMP